MRAKTCAYCRGRVFEEDRKCPSCGSAVFLFDEKPEKRTPPEERAAAHEPRPVFVQAPAAPEVIYVAARSTKNRWLALLLCAVLGVFGAHRFYVGKTASGVVWLLTAGMFGIGIVVDFLLILFGNFHDKGGLPLNA